MGVSCTRAEKATMDARARQLQMSRSKYVRACILFELRTRAVEQEMRKRIDEAARNPIAVKGFDQD